jgi:bacteriorhodopsin
MYWILMLLWFVFSLVWIFGGGAIGHYGPVVNSVLLFILFLLLGWKVFGQPIS